MGSILIYLIVLGFFLSNLSRQLEGRGIAAALVQRALGWAREQGLKVIPQCSFVASYIQGHPESWDLLAR